MKRLVFSEGADFESGVFQNAALDFAVAVSEYAHPALVAARAVATTVVETGAQAIGGTQPAAAGMPSISQSNAYGAGSAAWAQLGTSVFGSTAQAGDQLTLTTATSTYQVTIALAGLLTSGLGAQAGQGLTANSIRNGAKVAILVDGAVVQTLDTYGATPQITLYLDGLAHTIIIQHTGGYNGAISPIGAVTPTVGTTVSSMLAPSVMYHPTFVSATWRILATGSATYSLYKTPQGGSESLVASGLSTGTTYSGASYVPGVNLLVTSTTPLITNNAATFTTDVVMATVTGISYGTGTGSGASTWTSPVLDFGDPAMQMVGAEVVQSTALSAVSVSSGNVATPDGTWTTVSARQGSATTDDGVQYGTAGLMAAPPGRYGQITLQLAGVGTTAPWVRDLVLYAWNPARDPLGSRLVLHARQVLGPNLHAYLAALATWYADLRQAYLDLRAAGSIGGATDEYLEHYVGDVGLAWVTGEPTEAARARARGVLSSAGGALSLSGIAAQLNLLINGVEAPVTITGTPSALVATCGGCVVRKTSGITLNFDAIVPGAPYLGIPGLPVGPSSTPGTANALIADYLQNILRPVGNQLAAITFTTSS